MKSNTNCPKCNSVSLFIHPSDEWISFFDVDCEDCGFEFTVKKDETGYGFAKET